MYGVYANIWGIWMVHVTIYSIHGSYGNDYNGINRCNIATKLFFNGGIVMGSTIDQLKYEGFLTWGDSHRFEY